MSEKLSISAILVCQGTEYQSVCKGLKRVVGSKPLVIPIPIGNQPHDIYLPKLRDILNHPQPKVLVMGLCGGLSPRYREGDIVLYQDCIFQENGANFWQKKSCDRALTTQLNSQLQKPVSLVTGLTSDRVICSATQKRHLAQTSGADVVDMEGFALLELLNSMGVAVAMLRVVSDGCDGDIPDLNSALNCDGSLRPLALATVMLKQPIAATRLIRGSLKGLKVLEQVTTLLFENLQA